MAVTQKQIADHIGMSRSMVALALNEHPKISARTRLRVKEAAHQLGYSPHQNHNARALIARRYGKRVRSGIIAVVIPSDIPSEPVTALPFFRAILDGIEIEARSRDIDVFLCGLRPGGLPRLLQERGVDGIIHFGVNADVLERLADLESPLVSIGYDIEGTPSLTPDDGAGTRLTTRHLIAGGHRNIAYIGLIDGNPVAHARLESYRKALKEAGIELQEELIEATAYSTDVNAGRMAMERLLAQGKEFSAVVCYNDLQAMGAIHHLEEAGYAVPDDISVTGYDDVSPQYAFRPALTSIWFDRKAMGRRAVEILSDAIERYYASDNTSGNGVINLPLCETFPVKLMVRDSTRAIDHQKTQRSE